MAFLSLAQSKRAQPWVTPEIKTPGVVYSTFESKAAGGKVSVHVFLPKGYAEDPKKAYPVLYWLHGTGGGLRGIPPLSAHFSGAMEKGQVPPMIVVFVNGLPGGMYVDWKDGSVRVESMIMRDLIPWVDRTYRTSKKREDRILEGFSMGGYGAARLGFKFPEKFGAISMLAAGPLQSELTQTPRATPEARKKILSEVFGDDQAYFLKQSPWQLAETYATKKSPALLIQIVIGDKDETLENNAKFHQRLKHLKIDHTYTVLPGVGHDTMAIFSALGDSQFEFYRQALRSSK